MEAAASNPPQSTTLTIEARDLDTDARSRKTFEVVAPSEPAKQRAALIEAVAQHFPDAALRSFSDGAATFLDKQHLIVAAYAEQPRTRRRDLKVVSPESQDSLFAA
jgi:hypothetical protein